jgi:hypothetical protein
MDEEGRQNVWQLYGWYSGLMVCGSCFGAVAWSARMMNLVNGFSSIDVSDMQLRWSFLARGYSWLPAFMVTYAVKFMCLSAALLMVLDRLSVFAAPKGSSMRRRWIVAGQLVMAAVVLGNAAGLAANAASAVYYQKAADFAAKASALYAANNTDDGLKTSLQSQVEVRQGGGAAAVQRFCEVTVLFLIISALLWSGCCVLDASVLCCAVSKTCAALR